MSGRVASSCEEKREGPVAPHAGSESPLVYATGEGGTSSHTICFSRNINSSDTDWDLYLYHIHDVLYVLHKQEVDAEAVSYLRGVVLSVATTTCGRIL